MNLTEDESGMMVADVAATETESPDDEHRVRRAEHRHRYAGDLQREIVQHRLLPPESATRRRSSACNLRA